MNNLCVFGGTGFVGSEFVRQNPDVIMQDKYDYSPKTPNILNFISTVHNYNVYTDPYLDIDTNLNVMITLLEDARGHFGTDTMFNMVSTWFVYGNTDCPASEDSWCKPKGFYSITKLAAEQLLASYCETFGMHYRILRLGNVIGIVDKKASRKKNALEYMIQQVALGNDIDYLYKGDFYRDYIDVRDCARAIRIVLESGNLDEIYNVGNGVPININDTVFLARELANSKSKITLMEVPEFHKKVQVKDMWLYTKKIRDLGYKPSYEWNQTLYDLIEHYQHE